MRAHDPAAREHVTGYFKLHPDFVRIARAPAYPPLAREGGRLTIDTPDDLAFVEAVHARMAAQGGRSLAGRSAAASGTRAAVCAPSTRHVKQKPILPSGGLALIRCDGGGKFGYGHVKRMVALARALRDREGIGVDLCRQRHARMRWRPSAAPALKPTMMDDHDELSPLVDAHKPGYADLDGREGPDARGARNACAAHVAADRRRSMMARDRAAGLRFRLLSAGAAGAGAGLDRRAHACRASAGNGRCWDSIRI